MFLFKVFLRFFVLLIPALGYALSPIVQFQDLVAGDGERGFEDGPFYSAQFNRPMGLAFDPDHSILYIADQDNNRIRAVDLTRKNEVTTFAGMGMEGKNDGPLTLATFRQPAGLVLLPGGQLAVNDLGNNLIRLIDLKAGTVSTLAGTGSMGTADGEALQAQLGGLWNMAYWPSDQSLYFSQPSSGALRRLDLKTQQVETVLKDNPLIPHPAALGEADGKLFVADEQLGQIYEILPLEKKKEPAMRPRGTQTYTPGPTPTFTDSVSLRQAGQGHNLIALAGSGKALYAYQVDPKAPLLRVFPDPAPITFGSVWGDQLINPDPGSILPQFKGLTALDRAGFIPNPLSEGSFFLTNPFYSIVSTFRDLRLTDRDCDLGELVLNSAGIHELEYPYAKPPHTFRILLVGRSYIYWVAREHQFEQKILEGEKANLLMTLAKRVELRLNTRAALEDSPYHYEVLNGGMHSGNNELNLWPYYVVPGLAQKYDIDLVIIMCDGYLGLDSCFNSPLTPEGIPGKDIDTEYLLKPNSEKFKEGPLHDFFELCLAKKLVDIHSPTLWMPNVDGMIADPVVRERLIEIAGKPLKLLQQKVSALKTSGGSQRRLELCTFPVGDFPSKTKWKFWEDLCSSAGLPYFDLADEFKVLGLTYSPYVAGHFTENGMFFFSDILVDELLRNQKIPFKSAVP